jgi:hypothetical protein
MLMPGLIPNLKLNLWARKTCKVQQTACVWQCCTYSSYSLQLTAILIAFIILMVASVTIVSLIFSMQNRNKHCYNRWHRWSFEILTSESESGRNLSPENIRTVICVGSLQVNPILRLEHWTSYYTCHRADMKMHSSNTQSTHQTSPDDI